MAKYRLLTNDELQSLEKEFVDYLIINGIDSAEWVKIKTTKPTEADQIVDLFSDVVFEKILRKAEYLIFYSHDSIKVFKCDAEEIYLLGLDTSDPNYDLMTKEGVIKAQQNPPNDLKGYRTSKGYKPNRETEIFRMMENGCEISDGKIYKLLDELI